MMENMEPREGMEEQQTVTLAETLRKGWQAFLRLLWWVAMFFFVQNAVASRLENEPRAALLYWMIAAALLLAGGIVSLSRRINLE